MRKLAFIAFFLLFATPLFAGSERMVVMEIQGWDISAAEADKYRNAIIDFYRGKYHIISGPEVDRKVKEIFEKESREEMACDETKCFQEIAAAFQAELIATGSVMKKNDGYRINLRVINVLENRSLMSKSFVCRDCDEKGVIKMIGNALAGRSVETY